MSLSAFDVIGPVMVGPSSSHTAGAARLGLVGRGLLGQTPAEATLTLHGSFASTGRGHATDRALVAGLLGFAPDDARLPDALDIAAEAGIKINFEVEDFGQQAHPNSVRLDMKDATGQTTSMTGASLGGGIIEVSDIDGYTASFRGDLNTLVCYHYDKSGFLARVTAILACVDANIAALRTSRNARGRHALTVIETDGAIPPDALSVLLHSSLLLKVRVLAPLP